MEIDERETEKTGNDKTFINRLLGEMKNQFNKTASLANSTPVSGSNELLIMDCNTIPPNSLDVDETNSESVPLEGECDKSECTDERESKEIDLDIKTDFDAVENVIVNVKQEEPVNDETHVQEETQEKPRIVLTFRKPATSDKAKGKDEKNGLKRRALRTQLHILEDNNVALKRSSRRRSRDCNESVLQSAIARKEKSYNEASKPQRLTKQLKATPKILENIANAASKLEKTKTEKSKPHKTDKHKIIDNDSDNDSANLEDTLQSESEGDNERSYRKNKHKNFRNVPKKIKYTKETRDSDSDHSVIQDVKEVDKNKDSKCNIEEKACRRSHRLSSRMRDESIDDLEDTLESLIVQEDCVESVPSVEAQLIASRLCLCNHKSQIYIYASNDEMIHCTAIDSIGDRLVGCNNLVNGNEMPMLRPSNRVPYIILCEMHFNRMLRHNCCPKCGLFCTQGQFAQCEAKHQYHRECQISVGDTECCPHCGLLTPEHDVLIKMHSSKKIIFLPNQKSQSISAKMSFQPENELNEGNKMSSPIIPPNLISSSLNGTVLNSEKYNITSLFQVLKDGDSEKLFGMLGSTNVCLNTPLEDCEGGTLLHYAASNGLLSVVHILVVAGAELDVLDREQNTALVCAILSFKNDVVKYLIKAGACLTLKGTDGMTSLHIAAKSGNLNACKLLLNARLGKKDCVNIADDGGWTPLVWACEHGHYEIVEYLLHKGADPLNRDVEQNIALHWGAFSGSADIIELLLNKKSDVNAVNAHGDTPLHIGARQNRYNCIVILLARGADVNIVNKAGETALDCTKPTSDCHVAISFNIHLQGLVSADSKSHQTILTNDISNGREVSPIQCINLTDDEQKPSDFTYVTENCISSDAININRKISTMQMCACEEKCATLDCLCYHNSLNCWYNEEARLVSDFNFADPPMIFECNQLCSCNAITCSNRVVQHGLTQRFQLFKTESKGWGIRVLNNIAKGSYVCEYIGEVITDVEADQREDDSFIFDLDSKESDSFCIDAKQYGNLSRFINHSCYPNLTPIRVFVEHHDLRFPRIAFFANRDIVAEEELSFDYGERFWVAKYQCFTCECGHITCKYSDEAIVSTVENYSKKQLNNNV